jgi:hypothetical protein
MAIDTTDIQDIAATESINRVAFPAYKVFIYGKDVSSDVAAVRLNQSGGSLERSPMTCSITLQNLQDKYILDNKDIVNIGIAKSKIDAKWENVVVDSTRRIEGSNVSFPLGGQWVSLDIVTIKQLAPKLAQSSDEEKVYLLRAYLGSQGSYEINEKDAEALTKELQIALQHLESTEMQEDVFDSYQEESLGYSIKQQVIHDKLAYTVYPEPLVDDNSVLEYDDRIIFDYPMQEGDCIFHANDPVRVAIRDPFDPRVWYWGFTGFIDTWTEDMGMNYDSEVTITCTDVSKMARYAIVQLKTGMQDPNVDVFLQGLRDQGGSTVANSDLILTKELFEGLSIIEILEVIFFGSQSAIELVDGRLFQQIDALASLDVDELRNFFVSKFNMTVEQAYEFVPYGIGSTGKHLALWNKIKNKVTDVLQSKAVARFNALNWEGITSPRDISFKRSKDVGGVHYYVLGTPSDTDLYFGAKELKDLYNWNETIHHRVRKDDLHSMNKGSYIRPTANLDISQVIHLVGTDLENYPVGGGRVFFMAPAKMDSIAGQGVLDKAFGGIGSMHSVFKDRLSYLYDLADVVDFRFYASPKGDLIFEMPFYDYDPSDFWQSKDLATEGLGVSTIDDDYETIFKQAYAGDYPTSEWDSLTDMALEKNTSNLDLIEYDQSPKFDYGRHFTIDLHEQMGFSNTMSDRGVLTAYRVKANYIANLSEQQNQEVQKYKMVLAKPLIPHLGFRIGEGNMWGFVKGEDAAELYAALELNRNNAESRNIGVQTIPKFGLMVNRPLHWKYRNYYANIVSISHSIVWNSDVNTSINLNQIRGWPGEIDKETKKPIHRHFGDTNRPFNLVEILNRAQESEKKKKQGGV